MNRAVPGPNEPNLEMEATYLCCIVRFRGFQSCFQTPRMYGILRIFQMMGEIYKKYRKFIIHTVIAYLLHL